MRIATPICRAAISQALCLEATSPRLVLLDSEVPADNWRAQFAGLHCQTCSTAKDVQNYLDASGFFQKVRPTAFANTHSMCFYYLVE